MSSHFDNDWTPGSDLLAAYADGEFEGRDELVVLRRRVEEWLGRHPRAQEELAQYRKLRQLWLATSPAEPSSDAWSRMQVNLQRLCAQSAPRLCGRRRAPWAASALVAAACLTVVITFQSVRQPGQTNGLPVINLSSNQNPFPVVGEREVTILRVNGDDARSVVVGVLPLQGLMDVAAKGDVTLTSMKPHGRSNVMPNVHQRGPDAPMMIWARTDSEPEK